MVPAYPGCPGKEAVKRVQYSSSSYYFITLPRRSTAITVAAHIGVCSLACLQNRCPHFTRFTRGSVLFRTTRGPAYYVPLASYRRRSAWSTFPPLCSDQSSAGAVRETVYRRRPGLPGRRTHHREQPAGQRDISPVSASRFPQRLKTFLFQASFPDIIIDSW